MMRMKNYFSPPFSCVLRLFFALLFRQVCYISYAPGMGVWAVMLQHYQIKGLTHSWLTFLRLFLEVSLLHQKRNFPWLSRIFLCVCSFYLKLRKSSVSLSRALTAWDSLAAGKSQIMGCCGIHRAVLYRDISVALYRFSLTSLRFITFSQEKNHDQFCIELLRNLLISFLSTLWSLLATAQCQTPSTSAFEQQHVQDSNLDSWEGWHREPEGFCRNQLSLLGVNEQCLN